MNQALFLDRDGVINQEKGRYVFQVDDFDILPGLMPSLKKVTEKGIMIFVVTNQGGIAKGLYTHEDVKAVHSFMLKEFQKEGIKVDAIYYCPHHSDVSACLCRKPGSSLFEKIVARFKVNTELSLMIGDRERDILAAEKVGIKGVQIESNQNIEQIITNWLNG